MEKPASWTLRECSQWSMNTAGQPGDTAEDGTHNECQTKSPNKKVPTQYYKAD